MPARMHPFWRAVLATLLFALLLTWTEVRVQAWAADAVFQMGKRAGCHYFQSGVIAMTPSGPFLDGPWSGLFNALYRWLPGLASLVLPGAGAIALYDTLTRKLRPAPDGVTRCGRCGYELNGLREPRCPECGRKI